MANGYTSIKKAIALKTAIKYRLFTLAALFVLGQLFFTYKGVETLPFYNYGMYSAPLAATDTFEQLEVFIDRKAWNYHEAWAFPADFLESQLAFYNKMQRLDFKDPVLRTVRSRFGSNSGWENRLGNTEEVRTLFPRWLSYYLKARGKVEIGQQVSLMRRRYVYTEAGWPKPVDTLELVRYAVD